MSIMLEVLAPDGLPEQTGEAAKHPLPDNEIMTAEAGGTPAVKCSVLLLSGFLGSGKTTMLRHLLASLPDGMTAAVLMNEFGKAGVDGDVVRERGLEVIEISRGSIFCACAKGDYLRALYTIFRDYSPSMLIVEASGAADTTDMARDFSPSEERPYSAMLSKFYSYRGSICLVDAERFRRSVKVFTAVSRQIAAADVLILNKTDAASHDERSLAEAELRELNQSAPIIPAAFGNVSWETLNSALESAASPGISAALPNEEEWERFIDSVLADTERHLKPPDNLSSLSVFWDGDPDAFAELLQHLPDDTVRSKGYFKDRDGAWRIFDIVGNGAPVYSEPNADFAASRNLAIFIREKRARREIPALFQDRGLTLLEVRF